MNKNNPIKNKTLSRFSIRKCSVGTASFLIGTVAFFGIHHEAFAAENSTAPVTVTQLKENPSQNTVDSSASTEATNTNTQAPTDVQSPSQSNPEQSSPATQATETTETTNPSDGTQTADSSNNKTEPSADANKVDTNTSTDTANGQSKEQQETTPLSESQPTTTSEQSNTTTSPQTNTQELPSTENTNTTPTTQAASAEQPTESTPQSGENANIQNVNTINTPASPSQLTKIEGTTQARALDATTTQPTAAGGSNVNDKVTASNIKTTESYIEPNNSGSFYLRTQFTVNGDVKEGDYFTVTMPETVNIYGDTRYHSDDRESLKSADGQVIAIGTYDVPTHKMTYTFTNVVNNLTNVTGSFNLTQFMDRKAAPNSQVYPLKYDVAGESFETNLDVYYGKYYNYKDSNLKSMITMEDTKTGDYEQYIYVNPLKMTATDSVVRVQGFQKDPTASNGQLNQQNSKIQIFKVNDNQNLNSSFGVNDGDYQDVTNQFNITYYNKDNVADINFGTLNGARYIVKVTSKEVADSKADLQLRSIMYTKNAYNQYDTITWDNDILKSASSGTADGTEALYNLGDKVWNDVNKNGIQDAGEVGIPNVKVTLKDSNGTVIATTETNTNGKYVFNKLKNGVYYVDFETPANYTPTVANQENDALDSDGPLRAPAIISDGNNLTVDQGFYLTETPKYNVGDKVWEDSNKNGIQDADEKGISGVTVTLKDTDGNIVGTQVTDANGNYLFEKVAEGEYHIDFTTPEGYTPTITGQGPVENDSNGVSTNLIVAGQDDLTIDSGFYRPTYNVGDKVWEDSNKDGIQQDNEKGISGVTVTLKDTAGNVIGTQVTDANGNYLFDNVNDGEYKIEFTTPQGYTPTVTGQGTADKDSNGVSTTVTVAGHDDVTIDSGFYRPTYKVGDKVWEDSNKDGIQQDNEKGISGVTVTLKDNAGNVIGTQVTDANGNYLFDNVNDGEYKIEFTTPQGYTPTVIGQGSTDKDSNGVSTTVTVAGHDDVTIDSGFYRPTFSVGDKVWEDSNKDGIQDADEKGISGVTVTLTRPDGSTVTTTTDANGEYHFNDLVNGQYKITFQTPEGFQPTATHAGGNNATDSDGTSVDVTVNNADDLTIDSGFYRPTYNVGDKVWEDSNKDGIQDADEKGIPGVTVTLKDATGNIIGTRVTDENGNYLFDNVNDGEYKIEFTTPQGYTPTVIGQGSTDKDSNGVSTTVTVAGHDDLTIDSGFHKDTPDQPSPEQPSEPGQPNDPTPEKPSEPGQPNNPSPEQPSEPGQPNDPTPEKPSEPGQPNNPSPEQPSHPAPSKHMSTLPETGQNPSQQGTLLGGILAALGALLFARKKRKSKKQSH